MALMFIHTITADLLPRPVSRAEGLRLWRNWAG